MKRDLLKCSGEVRTLNTNKRSHVASLILFGKLEFSQYFSVALQGFHQLMFVVQRPLSQLNLPQ